MSTDKSGTQLNKFLANAGICSRRQAVDFIKEGLVRVNGQVETNPAFRVYPSDSVKYRGKQVKLEESVYLLLNKPKGYITTVSDDLGRRTVMDLVTEAHAKRLYPIGRLDKDTTGVLLLTNDGELAQKLAHPRYKRSKIYQVTLDKALASEHSEAIRKGLRLQDGPIKVDKLSINPQAPFSVMVEIHSGKNRIVRRLFEKFGYNIMALDRTGFSGLTKRGIPKGGWRYLTAKEAERLAEPPKQSSKKTIDSSSEQ